MLTFFRGWYGWIVCDFCDVRRFLDIAPIMRKLFISLFLLFASSAFAAGPAQTIYQINGSTAYYGTLDSLCAAIVAQYNASGDPTVLVAVVGGNCQVKDTKVGTFLTGGFSQVLVCSFSGGVPVFASASTGQCPAAPPACSVGSLGSMSIITAYATGPGSGSAIAKKIIPDGGLPSAQFCSNSCTVGFDSSVPNTGTCGSPAVADAKGYYPISCTVPMKGLGTPCASSTPVVNDPAQEPTVAPPSNLGACPIGSVPSGQDQSGMTICVGKTVAPNSSSTSATTSPTTTTTDSSNDTVTSSTTTVKNSDGSSTATTTTTTTTPSGAKTVAVTSSTTAASAGGAGVSDAQKPTDMCALHPELNVCQNSQVMGQCALITCSGDAITCSVARTAADMDCKDQAAAAAATALPSTATGAAILAGADPLASQISALTTGTSVDLSSTALDGSGFLGGGSCLADRSFVVAGQSVPVHFAFFCDHISSLRFVVLACAAIASYMLVSKSVLQGA
ncbi:virulence factor TspB C-terminal domain-related protein [Pseudomonas sp.]|uniref:virulence factor TspB C-terminal domain-related protein n=1 Tax=Pseudomonas sp. TaxID=306 RepID=UPI0026156C16|nr:virulence factor TspB C-terminal domain-related protein [Pseudomonas sp.]